MRLISFLLALTLTSCASFFSKNKTSKGRFSGSDLTIERTVEVDVNHRYVYANGDLKNSVAHSPYGWSSPQEIKSFKICKTHPCREKADLTVLIDLYYGKTESIFMLFSAMTLTVLPAKEREKLAIVAVVLDQEKRVMAKYKMYDEIITWYQLFLVFAMPFQDSEKADKLMSGLVSDVLWKAKADGLI